MKFKQLVLLGATSFLASAFSISGYAARVSGNPSSNAMNPGANLTLTKDAMAQNMSAVMMSGTFVAAEKPTTGTARIVRENGRRYLELDGAFRTSDQGPDLHVLLETADKPPQSYQDPSTYVNLGKLQKFSGTQRYPIPAAINISNFKSVAIWCRMANATFGYAMLGSARNATTR
ncbi:DM13 domain-containing protein [Argonema antarcticum]|uniref:DM13 domain-containing protein n=1 Tax=Argonema antarcticum TaxID=2942763 RepID=UPI002012B230|nr:DM13 domain-containing protein [Argonema antarcticum]MCL1470237.1 DM13 domain-containing protein [Argonema antarcticum A004/B2]